MIETLYYTKWKCKIIKEEIKKENKTYWKNKSHEQKTDSRKTILEVKILSPSRKHGFVSYVFNLCAIITRILAKI